MRNRLFYFLFVLVIVIGLLHWMGGTHFLYWHFWWYDILMHFLGGLWVALAALWISHFSEYVSPFQKRNRNFFVTAVVTVILVGLAWEVFEYVAGITSLAGGEPYIIDTISDLGMDTIGALVGYLYYSRRCL